MRATRIAVLTTVTALALSGCSWGAEGDDPTVAAPTSGAAASPLPGGTTLTARVGTKDEPEAFEISLTDPSGAPVTQLSASSYPIDVVDESVIHNFALKGDGVEMATGVSKKESPTWTLTFKAGDYTFTCDPHPRMSGSFVVV